MKKATTTNDLSSYKSAFQNMLMSSTNNMMQLLKNKQKAAQAQPKGILKRPSETLAKASSSSSSDDEQQNPSSQDAEFNPIASSTQFESTLLQKTPKQAQDSKFDNKMSLKKKKIKQEIDTDTPVNPKKRRPSTSEQSSMEEYSRKRNDSVGSYETPRKSKKKKKKTIDDEEPRKSKKKKHEEPSGSSSEDETTQIEQVNSRKARSSPQKHISYEKSSSEDERPTVNRNSEQNDSSSSDFDEPKRSKSRLAPSDKPAQLLDKHCEKHNLSRLKVQTNPLNDISSNEELYFVQVPVSVNPKELEGLEIDLNSKSKFRISGKKYDCIPSEERKKINLIAGSRMQTVTSKGSIKITRHVKLKNLPDLQGNWTANVEFPTNLKERHPLFGADYSDKISLEDTVQEKLRNADEASRKKKKKKSKKVKKERHEDDEPKPVEQEEIFEFLKQSGSSKPEKVKSSFSESETEVKKSKKKKKKIKEEPDERVSDSETVVDAAPKKKKKKRKKKPEEEDDDKMSLINQMLSMKNMEISSLSSKRKRHSSKSSS